MLRMGVRNKRREKKIKRYIYQNEDKSMGVKKKKEKRKIKRYIYQDEDKRVK